MEDGTCDWFCQTALPTSWNSERTVGASTASPRSAGLACVLFARAVIAYCVAS